MKNKIIGYLLLLPAVAAIGFTACKKFLNPTLQGVYSADQLNNKKGVNGMLINAYATLDGPSGTFHTGASNWAWGSITAGDAYKGTEITDGTDITPIMRFELGPNRKRGRQQPRRSSRYRIHYDSREAATGRCLSTPCVKQSAEDRKGAKLFPSKTLVAGQGVLYPSPWFHAHSATNRFSAKGHSRSIHCALQKKPASLAILRGSVRPYL